MDDANPNPQLPAAFEIIPWGVSILYLALLIAALVGIHRNARLTGTERLIWTIVVIFLPVIGAVLWFIYLGSKRRTQVTS